MSPLLVSRLDRATKARLAMFDLSSRLNINVIWFDPSSGLKHRQAVICLAQAALERGEPFVTRARLDLRFCGQELVADFYKIGWNTVYEVADSEDQASIERKEKLWRALGFHFEVLHTEVLHTKVKADKAATPKVGQEDVEKDPLLKDILIHPAHSKVKVTKKLLDKLEEGQWQ